MLVRGVSAIVALVCAACSGQTTRPQAAPLRGPTVPQGARADGPWPYETRLSQCITRLLPAPADVSERTLAAARQDLRALGRVTDIELTPLKDRVESVRIRDGRGPVVPPVDSDHAHESAMERLRSVVHVFGLTVGQLADMTNRMHGIMQQDGAAYFTQGLAASVYDPEEFADVHVKVDARGAVIEIEVQPLLPRFTMCTTTLERGEIEAAVVGQRLVLDTLEGTKEDLGLIEPANITEFRRIHYRRDEPPAVVVGAAYQVSVEREGAFEFYVDPATRRLLPEPVWNAGP